MADFYADRAALYDLAFDWDVTAEVDWLLARLGASCRAVLEPGCGSGRMFPAFGGRGVTVTGLDLSETMLARAKERMRRLGLPEPPLRHADMTDFDLGRTYDGAILPINTFGYLQTEAQARQHLICVARHLPPGSKYLVQVDLRELTDYRPLPESQVGSWEMTKDGVRLKTTWGSKSFDPASRIETQFSRFEVLAGSDAGRVVEDEHRMRMWDWRSWRELLSQTAFRQTAAYNGNSKEREPLELGPALNHAVLTWHELTRKAE